MEPNRTKVTEEQAKALAEVNYTLTLEGAKERGMRGPLVSKELWVRNRTAEIMSRGATPGDLETLKKANDEKKAAS